MAGVLAYENLLDHGACGDFFLDDDNLSPRPHSQSMDESSVPESSFTLATLSPHPHR